MRARLSRRSASEPSRYPSGTMSSPTPRPARERRPDQGQALMSSGSAWQCYGTHVGLLCKETEQGVRTVPRARRHRPSAPVTAPRRTRPRTSPRGRRRYEQGSSAQPSGARTACRRALRWRRRRRHDCGVPRRWDAVGAEPVPQRSRSAPRPRGAPRCAVHRKATPASRGAHHRLGSATPPSGTSIGRPNLMV